MYDDAMNRKKKLTHSREKASKTPGVNILVNCACAAFNWVLVTKKNEKHTNRLGFLRPFFFHVFLPQTFLNTTDCVVLGGKIAILNPYRQK